MTTFPKTLGFTVSNIERGEGRGKVARFRCQQCFATLDLTIKPGKAMSPDHFARMAARSGWRADPERMSKTLCPDCLHPAKPPAAVTAKRIQSAPQPTQEPAMSSPKITPIKPTVVNLTADQRVQVRHRLDKHFDDSVGVYLDGMTDQKIADELDVPRAIIEQMREAAYGPIRVHPDILLLRNEVAMFQRVIDEHQRELDALRAKAADMETRLAKLVGDI
jgi:hypothetical protein